MTVTPAAKRERRRRWPLLAGLALLALLGIAMCRGVAERGRYTTEYSTFGAGPDGAKGAYLLLERLGAHPRRWVQDLDHLPARAALVVLGDCRSTPARAVSRAERRQLDAWVRAGGTLVVAGASGYVAADDYGVSLAVPRGRCRARGKDERAERLAEGERARRDPVKALAGARSLLDDPEPVTVRAVPADPELGSVGSVTLVDPLAIKLEGPTPAGTRRLLVGPGDETLGIAVPRGRGHLLLLASGDLLRNETLAASGGDVLLVKLLRVFAPHVLAAPTGQAPPVLFDEYHLGIGESRGLMTYLQQVGLGPVALQAAIVLALVVLAFAARFGAPRIAAPPAPHDARTYVGALGRIYARAADAKGTVGLLVREALARVAREQHVGATDAEQLAARLAARKQDLAAEAVRRLARIPDEDVRGRGVLVETVRSIDGLVDTATRRR